jgi:hypothetical protein
MRDGKPKAGIEFESRLVINAADPSVHWPQPNWGGLIIGKHGPSGTDSEMAEGWLVAFQLARKALCQAGVKGMSAPKETTWV